MSFIEEGCRVWAIDEDVEFWIITHKETGKILRPRDKHVFDSEKNALKSFYHFYGSKEEALRYIDKFDFIMIARYPEK